MKVIVHRLKWGPLSINDVVRSGQHGWEGDEREAVKDSYRHHWVARMSNPQKVYESSYLMVRY